MLYRPFGLLVAASLAITTGCSIESPPVGEWSAALTFPNDQPAFDYFRGKGLSAVQAAGIVGNLDQESGVDPTSVQLGGGPGRGIAQWSVGGRWDTSTNDNAKWYATKQGVSVLALSLQLDFIWYELTTFQSYGLAALQSATTVSAATISFQNDFEGCGVCNQSQRISYAQAVLTAFGSDQVDGSAPTDASAPTDLGPTVACTVPATNVRGVCVDVGACAILGGTAIANLCAGPNNIQCCTPANNADAATPALDAGTGGDQHGCSNTPGAQSTPSAAFSVLLLGLTLLRHVHGA